MSELTPAVVLKTLADIGKDIDAATKLLRSRDEAETMARHAYKRAFNVGLYKYKADDEGKPYTADIRRAKAEDSAAELELAWEVTRIDMQEVKDELRALRDRLDIGRSMSPIMRLEWGQS
jgi:hypothetical protein